jgi:glycosyltransferase involved in cell wall biosynthesis
MDSQEQVQVSVVIPAYNEEGRIGRALQAYLDYYRPRYGEAFELLVVLNGCTDRTEEVVESFRSQHSQLSCLTYLRPLGKGGAVLEGLRRARGQRLAFVDADNMVGPQGVARLLDALDQHEVAIGARWGLGPPAEEDRPFLRRFSSRLLTLWNRLFLGLPYPDTQCGAKALRREAAQRLAEEVTEKGWAFDIDLLACAERRGYRVAQVPVSWHHVPYDSKVRLWRDGPAVLRATWRIRGKQRKKV